MAYSYRKGGTCHRCVDARVLLPQNTHTPTHTPPHTNTHTTFPYTHFSASAPLWETAEETNGQAKAIALCCESLLGEMADVVVGPEPPGPPKDQAASSEQRSLDLSVLYLSDKLTSQVMSVTHWPCSKHLVKSGTSTRQLPKG